MQNVLQKKSSQTQSTPKPIEVSPSPSVPKEESKKPSGAHERNPHRRIKPMMTSLSPIAKAHLYALFFPALILSIMGYFGMFFIFRNVEPSTIQNIFWSDSYFPLIFLAAWAHFFFFSYLFLHLRRGLFMSLFLTSLLYLRLNHFLTPLTFVILFILLVAIESFLTIRKRDG